MHDGDQPDVDTEAVMVRKRRKGIYILPNLFTLAALFGGFYAIVMAMNNRFDMAAIGVFCALVLDSLDGITSGLFARLKPQTLATALSVDSISNAVKAEDGGIRIDLGAAFLQDNSKTLMFKYTHEIAADAVSNLLPAKFVGKMKAQPTQTQLVILCESNAATRLQEVSLLVTADSHASNMVAKPTFAVCNEEKKKILWRQDELQVGGEHGSAKFLAQWSVQEPSRPNPIAIKYHHHNPQRAPQFKLTIHSAAAGAGGQPSVVDAADRLEYGQLVTSLVIEPSLLVQP